MVFSVAGDIIDEREDGTTLYSDTVEIDAGFFTLPVWLFAQWLYRQRRWQRVARRLVHSAS